MNLCQICKVKPSTGGVIENSVYIKDICSDCKSMPQVSSGHARWARSIDVEDFEKDIQQPHNADGTINTKFARLYPKQARALFSDEQIRKASL